MKIVASVALALLLGACSTVLVARTPSQEGYEIGAKYLIVQNVILDAVRSPSVPAGAASRLTLLNRTAAPVVDAMLAQVGSCQQPCTLSRAELGVTAAASAVVPVYNALTELGFRS